MLWIIVIASVLGFLAVEWVANQPTITTILAQGFSQHTIINQSLIILIFIVLSVWLVIQKRQTLIDNSFTTFEIFFKKLPNFLLAITIFCLTLLASLSVGLNDYHNYQKNLLKQSLTITTTIKVNQLSDSVSQIIELDKKSVLLGASYPRQIWQVIDIEKFSGIQEQKIEQQLKGIHILATLDASKNSGNLQILNTLKPNDTVKVKLNLKPIYAKTTSFNDLPIQANIVEIGFDEKRWLRQRNVQALATVVEIDKNSVQPYHVKVRVIEQFLLKVEQLRWYFGKKLQQNMLNNFEENNKAHIIKTHDSHAILLGLLTGDRALMSSYIKNTYQQTGISHLLAISGPHVLMLASVLSLWVLGFVKLFLPKLLRKIPSKLLVLWVSVVVSGLYALFVGFELPAQRTFWLLLLMTFVNQLLITERPLTTLALVGLIMMWWDTTAVLQAGFWLSFVAVFLLIQFSEKVGKMQTASILGQEQKSPLQRFLIRLKQEFILLAKLQLWLFAFMMPIVIWFFGKISLIGLFVNLISVPFLGLVIVPLDMLAGVLSLVPILGGFGALLWTVLAKILTIFHQFLDILIQSELATPLFISLSQSQLILALLVAVIWFSRGIVSKFLLIPISLAIFLVGMKNNDFSQAKLIVLDNHRINMQLLLVNQQHWLILSDNQFAKKTPKKQAKKLAKTQETLENIAPQDWQQNLLNQQIYPILAKYKVEKLTGIISQTPTESTNEIVQLLAKNHRVGAYFLAGFDNIKPLKNDKNQNFSYPSITPKSCQAGQLLFDENGFKLQALTGWRLKLADTQIIQSERLALMPCFVSINYQNNKQILITSGNQKLPMQMLTTMYPNMCVANRVDLLISPYQLSYDKDWLMSVNPAQLQVITGDYDNQKISDSNYFSLLSLAKMPKIVQSDVVGIVEYRLQ